MGERFERIYGGYISPISLASIVVLNIFLIYLNLATLENQNAILYSIDNQTGHIEDLTLVNRGVATENTQVLTYLRSVFNESFAKSIEEQHDNEVIVHNLTLRATQDIGRILEDHGTNQSAFNKEIVRQMRQIVMIMNQTLGSP